MEAVCHVKNEKNQYWSVSCGWADINLLELSYSNKNAFEVEVMTGTPLTNKHTLGLFSVKS